MILIVDLCVNLCDIIIQLNFSYNVKLFEIGLHCKMNGTAEGSMMEKVYRCTSAINLKGKHQCPFQKTSILNVEICFVMNN